MNEEVDVLSLDESTNMKPLLDTSLLTSVSPVDNNKSTRYESLLQAKKVKNQNSKLLQSLESRFRIIR